MDMGAGDLWSRLLGEFPPHDAPFSVPGDVGEGPRSLALVLAYDGAEFAGWQVQPGERTVQGVVEEALSRLCDEPVRIQASGRTDAGVHALGQVAHFSTASRLETARMAAGLLALLPGDVLLRELGPVSPDFHARYGALAKTYEYWLWPGAEASLFLAGRLWTLEGGLDPAPVARALEMIIGDRDLKALASQGSEAKGSTVRRIMDARLLAESGGPWRVSITATGFLRHVVRNLVGVLSQIGAGRLAPEQLLEMLQAGQRLYAGPKAPPQGLYLSRVYYQDLPDELRED